MKKVIQQPNGLYCIFSTTINDVTHYDCDVEGVVKAYLDDDKSSMSFDEMIAIIEDVHGEEAAIDWLETLSNNNDSCDDDCKPGKNSKSFIVKFDSNWFNNIINNKDLVNDIKNILKDDNKDIDNDTDNDCV